MYRFFIFYFKKHNFQMNLLKSLRIFQKEIIIIIKRDQLSLLYSRSFFKLVSFLLKLY